MQARISPTSPAAKKSDQEMEKVWEQGQLQQPLRTPWAALVIIMIVVSAIISAGVIMGGGYLARRYPDNMIVRLLPTTSKTTTVIQTTKESGNATLPTTIQTVMATAYTVNRNQGEHGIYTASDATGYAWPLSSSGWSLSINGAWPSDTKSLVIIPLVGQPQAITTTLEDPATPFVFLKSSDISARPISFAPVDSAKSGAAVWVITGLHATATHLSGLETPHWASSDRLESTWSLDTNVTAPAGSAVVDVEGRLLGILGSENRVWPIEAVAPALKDVLQSSSIDRPVLGVQSLNRSLAAVAGEPTANGILIGADVGQTAVTAKSPADKAGIVSGDIITAIDGQTVNDNLFSTLLNYQPTDKLTVTLLRQSKEKQVTITLGSSHS